MTHKSKANELVETPESARRQRDHAVNLRELDEDAKWLAGALDDLAESVASASVRTLALGQEALALLREAQRPVAPAFVALAKIVTGVSEIIVWATNRSGCCISSRRRFSSACSSASGPISTPLPPRPSRPAGRSTASS